MYAEFVMIYNIVNVIFDYNNKSKCNSSNNRKIKGHSFLLMLFDNLKKIKFFSRYFTLKHKLRNIALLCVWTVVAHESVMSYFNYTVF